MRYFYAAITALALLIGTTALAEEAKRPAVFPKDKVVDIDKDEDGIIEERDVYNEKGRLIRREYDTNDDRVMDRYQTYDPNTGLPNIVESDTTGEL